MIDKMTDIRHEILYQLRLDNISVMEAKMLNKYVYEKTCDYGEESLFDYLACESVISEAEEDHKHHMILKKQVAEKLGKTSSELPNKKYKNEKSSKRADLKYSAKEKTLVGKNVNVTFNPNSSTFRYITKDSPKESDIKILNYMKKHANFNNKDEVKKYKAAFRMFCTKYGIDKNSSLYIEYDPDDDKKMRMIEWQEGKKMDKKQLDPKNETRLTIPHGYCLVHKSPSKNLTELKPRQVSNKYISKGRSGVSGQYHSTGRVYFVVCKNDDIDTGRWGMGGGFGSTYLYTPVGNISGIYVDYEDPGSRNSDRYYDIEKMVGKPVYIKTDKPIKVKLIKKND